MPPLDSMASLWHSPQEEADEYERKEIGMLRAELDQARMQAQMSKKQQAATNAATQQSLYQRHQSYKQSQPGLPTQSLNPNTMAYTTGSMTYGSKLTSPGTSTGTAYAGGGGGAGVIGAAFNNPYSSQYQAATPVDFIGPFTFAQKQLMESRFVGIWDARQKSDLKPNELPVDEWWFAPSQSHTIPQAQSGKQMGDWQMGYDEGYEDGKAAK